MFKNNFGVKGPTSLLKALAEEAERLGWERYSNVAEDKPLYFNANISGDALPIGYYWFCSDVTINVQTLPQDWDKCIKLLGEKEEDYEIGEWLYFELSLRDNGIFKFNGRSGVRNFKCICSIYNCNGSLLIGTSSDNYTHENNGVRRATPEEIKEFLIMAAKEKGFVEGLPLRKISNILTGDFPQYTSSIEEGRWRYNVSTDELMIKSVAIYMNNKWATIADDSLIFGDRAVHVMKDGRVTFDSYDANIEEVQAIYEWYYPRITVGGYPFKPWATLPAPCKNTSITIGCTTGKLGELKAILDRYKEIKG